MANEAKQELAVGQNVYVTPIRWWERGVERYYVTQVAPYVLIRRAGEGPVVPVGGTVHTSLAAYARDMAARWAERAVQEVAEEELVARLVDEALAAAKGVDRG